MSQTLLRSSFVMICLFTLCGMWSCETIAQQPGDSWTANPDEVKRRTESSSEFNYEESKVPDYELPDPLVLVGSGGQTSIADPNGWMTIGRPKLIDAFRDEMYGRRPATKYEVAYEEVDRIEGAFDGLATGRQVRTTITRDGRSHQFDFVLFVPKSDQPVPIIVEINNRYFTPLREAATKEDPFWPVRLILQRGYATAAFHTSDVDPDRKDGYEDGIRALLDDPDSDPATRWRSLSAWGWAASRVLDFAVMQEQIDSRRSAVVGHSRGGKTALWAAAEDQRFTIAYSNDSGCGGAALSRRSYGETVARITSSFPHWFCDRFTSYGGNESQLPFDQHQLVALIAPRSVYVASADEDLWADPRGEYLSLVNAAPVFELLGIDSISDRQMPALDQPTRVGATGYHIRSGGHNLTEIDWRWFLDFADSRLKQ